MQPSIRLHGLQARRADAALAGVRQPPVSIYQRDQRRVVGVPLLTVSSSRHWLNNVEGPSSKALQLRLGSVACHWIMMREPPRPMLQIPAVDTAGEGYIGPPGLPAIALRVK
jgi:hypothetical protein